MPEDFLTWTRPIIESSPLVPVFITATVSVPERDIELLGVDEATKQAVANAPLDIHYIEVD